MELGFLSLYRSALHRFAQRIDRYNQLNILRNSKKAKNAWLIEVVSHTLDGTLQKAGAVKHPFGLVITLNDWGPNLL